MRHTAGLVMASVALVVASAVVSAAQAGQDSMSGPWTGEIRVAGITLQMRVVFTEAADALSATIDIPQQGATGIPLQNVSRDGSRVQFQLPAGPGLAAFDGQRDGDRIEGTFTQGPATGTFVLARGNEPPPPPEVAAADVPYHVEDVTFSHGAVTLAGTITSPRGSGPSPAVVFVSGSGPQSRDSDVAGFAVFATLADALTRQGIAVLRYDDRGVGGSSGPANVTTEAYTADVGAALALLASRPGVDPARLGVVGHSEGALVAARAANELDSVAFIALLAGTTVPGEQVVRGQAEAIVRASGGGDAQIAALRAQQDRLFHAVRTGEGWDAIEAGARANGMAQVAMMPEAERAKLGDPEAYVDGVVAQQLGGAKSDWYRFFVDYDPGPVLRAVDVPVFAAFGGRDLQVLVADNQPAIEAAFAGERARLLQLKVYPEANHLFQPARTGAPAEYPALPKAFVDGLVTDLGTWILMLPR